MAMAVRSIPDASAAEVLGPVLRRQVQELRDWEPGVRLEQAKAVHGYRVAARRLRSELAGFRSLLDTELCDELATELGRAAAAVSGARDAEVVRRRMGALLRDEPDDLTNALRAKLDGMHAEISVRSLHDAVSHLDGPHYDAFTRRLERFADLPPWSPTARESAPEVFQPLLRREWARFRARAGEAVAPASGVDRDARLHEARKAAKRARYIAETLTPVFGRPAKRLAQAAERVQLVLGDHQDCMITGAVLEQAAEEVRPDRHDGIVLDRMRAREAATAVHLREEFVVLYQAADRKKLRRWLS